MGYHDLAPEAFIFSVAVQETNTAEDAAEYDKWLIDTMKKARSLCAKDSLQVGSNKLCVSNISDGEGVVNT